MGPIYPSNLSHTMILGYCCTLWIHKDVCNVEFSGQSLQRLLLSEMHCHFVVNACRMSQTKGSFGYLYHVVWVCPNVKRNCYCHLQGDWRPKRPSFEQHLLRKHEHLYSGRFFWLQWPSGSFVIWEDGSNHNMHYYNYKNRFWERHLVQGERKELGGGGHWRKLRNESFLTL
jgi:hypothetical protein